MVSHERARSVFGKQQETPLETGLQAMVAWAKERGLNESKPPGSMKLEIDQDLPESYRVFFAAPKA